MSSTNKHRGMNHKNKIFYFTVWLIVSIGIYLFFISVYNSLVTKGVSIVGELASREILSANSKCSSFLTSAENNLNLIANGQYLNDYINTLQPYQIEDPNSDEQIKFTQFLIQLLKINPNYYSIRFVSIDGRERIKVENIGREQKVFNQEDLKDISTEYYVKDCLASPMNSIYYSHIDLQKSHGTIEFPFKPTLRIGKSIYSHIGKLKGIILINLSINFSFSQNLSLLNENGDWLIGGGENWMNFAFSRAENFKNLFPKAWKAITSKEFGNTLINDIYFEFTTLRPPSTDEGISWKIVSQHSIKKITNSISIISDAPILLLFAICEILTTLIIIITYIRQNKLLEYQHIIEENIKRYDISLKAGRAISWIYTPSTHMFTWSKNVEDILGIPAKKLIKEEQFIDLFNKYSDLKLKTFLNFINTKVSNDNNNELSLEHKIPLPQKIHSISSGELWLKTYAIKLDDSEGNNLVYGISYDITNRVILEQSAIESRKASENLSLELQNLLDESERLRIQAEEASSAKADFLANISHEIRTPMNSVLGMVSLLEETELTSKQLNYTSAIKHGGEALLLIINDILDHSKIESGKLDIIYEEFDIRETLNHLIDMITPQATQNAVTVTSFVDSEIPETLVGDELRITQVLLNIAGNAVKFTNSGNIHFEITILEDSKEDTTLKIKVSDTGIGIAPEALDHIFDKFTQADQSTTRKFGGTGLGLSICKSLIDLMNGNISVESVLGKSTTFTIILPLLKLGNKNLPHNFETRKSLSNNTQNKKNVFFPDAKILLCEDNEMNQNLCIKFLEKFSATADIAENGLVAIDMFTEKHYDLILMDLQMPELSGISATKRIREIEEAQSLSHTPIIAVTANIFDDDKHACHDAGMDGFLSKPVSLIDFKSTLINFLPERLQVIDEEISPIEETSYPSSKIHETEIEDNERKTTESVINYEAGVTNSGGEKPYKTMVNLFIDDTPNIITNIYAGLQDGDHEQASRHCHTLKSMAGIIGAIKLSEVCQEGETSTDCDNLSDIYSKIKKEATDAISELKEYSQNNKDIVSDENLEKTRTAESDQPHNQKINRDSNDTISKADIIDIELGIHNSGCKENFYEMLTIFNNEVALIIQGIEFESLSGNNHATFRHIHTLKNMASIIGASKLYNGCIEAETSKDCYVIQQVLPILKEEVNKVIEKSSDILP